MLDRGIIKKVLFLLFFFFKKVLHLCFPPKIFHMPVGGGGCELFVVSISIRFNDVLGGCNLNAKKKKKEKKKEEEKSPKAAVQHGSISS